MPGAVVEAETGGGGEGKPACIRPGMGPISDEDWNRLTPIVRERYYVQNPHAKGDRSEIYPPPPSQ